MTPPIRFLVLIVGGWTAVRVIATMYGEAPAVAQQPKAASAPALVDMGAQAATLIPAVQFAAMAPISRRHGSSPTLATPRLAATRSAYVVEISTPTPQAATPDRPRPVSVASGGDMFARTTAAAPAPSASAGPIFAAPIDTVPVAGMPKRLSGSFWLLARAGDETSLATGSGLLGGSQAGARLLYRVNDDASAPLSLSARLSSPLRRSGTETALGIEWQPVAGLPIRMLAERRERVSGEGRSAFALLAHGGVNDRPVAAGFTLDAYAQAGVVGARSRDLFADGGITLVRPVGEVAANEVAIGAGIWGGAQPGVSRLDVGPRVTTTIAVAGTRARLSLDYRLRVAGDAAPASGPSLTIGAGF